MSLRDTAGSRVDGDERESPDADGSVPRPDTQGVSLDAWLGARNGGPMGLLAQIGALESACELESLFLRINNAIGIRKALLGMLRDPEIGRMTGSASGRIDYVACRQGAVGDAEAISLDAHGKSCMLLRLPGNGFAWIDAVCEMRQTDLFPYMMIATAILDRFRAIAEARFLSPLTPRQRECIMWTALGKTSGEIGGILGLSENTVNNYIAASIIKLGAVNKTHLVHLCLGRTSAHLA